MAWRSVAFGLAPPKARQRTLTPWSTAQAYGHALSGANRMSSIDLQEVEMPLLFANASIRGHAREHGEEKSGHGANGEETGHRSMPKTFGPGS
jgi:hypothetical protein